MWVMGEWAVGHWIVGIMSFQKIYGLYGLKHHTVDLLSCIVDPDFSCPRTDGLTEVFQEVLADLKNEEEKSDEPAPPLATCSNHCCPPEISH